LTGNTVSTARRRPAPGRRSSRPIRGPKHVGKKSTTPVLDGDEARWLLENVDTSTIVGLRDRY
jgi:hypothetical protein